LFLSRIVRSLVVFSSKGWVSKEDANYYFLSVCFPFYASLGSSSIKLFLLSQFFISCVKLQLSSRLLVLLSNTAFSLSGMKNYTTNVTTNTITARIIRNYEAVNSGVSLGVRYMKELQNSTLLS